MSWNLFSCRKLQYNIIQKTNWKISWNYSVKQNRNHICQSWLTWFQITKKYGFFFAWQHCGGHSECNKNTGGITIDYCKFPTVFNEMTKSSNWKTTLNKKCPLSNNTAKKHTNLGTGIQNPYRQPQCHTHVAHPHKCHNDI